MIDCKVDYEIGKILKNRVVFECVENRIGKLSGNSGVDLACAASGFDATVEVVQAGTIAFGDECTLHQRGAWSLLRRLAMRPTRRLSPDLLTLGAVPIGRRDSPILHECPSSSEPGNMSLLRKRAIFRAPSLSGFFIERSKNTRRILHFSDGCQIGKIQIKCSTNGED